MFAAFDATIYGIAAGIKELQTDLLFFSLFPGVAAWYPAPMPDRTKNRWAWLRAETDLFRCYLILQDENVAHLSFSAVAHARALGFLRQQGIPIPSLSRHAALAHRIQDALAAYTNGNGPLQLPFFPASPFWTAGTPFQQGVWAEIGRIPYGETRTYGELAARLGIPGGARAIGQACHRNPLALIIPCHRVVAAHGPGGFAGAIDIKQRLLALEKSR